MVDLVITAASVKKTATSQFTPGIAGAAITAGQALAQNAAGVMVLYDADSATAELRVFKGIALHAAAVDQPISYATKGPLTIGAAVVASTPYFGSATPGGICPAADVVTGMFATFLGFGVSATQIDVQAVAAGVVKP